HLEDALHARVVDQDEAVVAVADAIRRSRSGMSDPKRPIGSFLFLGPTGVGKTELAKTLADYLFDDEDALLRLDMSEYMEPHTVSRLFGSPRGYEKRRDTLGFSTSAEVREDEQIERRLKEELKKTFRPEFLNRIDEVIVFHRLPQASLFKVVDRMLAELRTRLAERKLTL